MKLLRGFQHILELSLGTVATIGNFDGVHLGHQEILSALRSEATRMQLPLLVMLFEPQPGEYFQGQQAPARISSLREKMQMLRQCGVDYVYCLKFDGHLASMSATEFSERFIFSLIKARYLLVGEDFRFGRGRLGDFELLHEMGGIHSCVVEKFNDFFIDEQRVSSTKIRQALHQGEFKSAAKLLGRPYTMCGRVVHGEGRGGQWGIPTANLRMNRTTLPLKGVFCVRVMRQGKPTLAGVANIGCRPTIDGSKNVLEIHLFDFDESLYGEMLQVCFLRKIREEMKFSSIDALIEQIRNDISAARAYCAEGCS